MGYYWPTMECDCVEYVKKHFKYQQHANLYIQLSQALQLMQSLWPLSIWVLDLIGKILTTSLGVHKFIITSIEYFTKWVESIPMILGFWLKL